MVSAPVLIALSGGVDSAVAALRLIESGDVVEALFMKNWEEDDDSGHCGAEEDLASARAVCDRLGIPLHTVNLSADYWERVFVRFLDMQRRGLTGNPDVLCNPEIKFGALFEQAVRLGASAVATGHYARIDVENGRYRLLRGQDPDKDQSYFLHRLNQEQLAFARFPLGDLSKGEVRRVARARGLPNHDRPDSTGICFIGERRFADFLARWLPERAGEIHDDRGRCIGTHRGVHLYTLGQRSGLGVGGRRAGNGAPWYVASKSLDDNILIAVQGADHPMLHHRGLFCTDAHWVAGQPPGGSLRLHARIRHRQTAVPCEVLIQDAQCFRVRFDAPVFAPAPGQSAVLYEGDACLGGGVIDVDVNRR